MLRKYWLWIVAALALAIGAGLWAARGQIAYAHIATAYAAKTTCSCVHVSGRSLASCTADFPPDAQGLITVTERGDRMRASVLFGAISAEAVYEGEFGCRIAS